MVDYQGIFAGIYNNVVFLVFFLSLLTNRFSKNIINSIAMLFVLLLALFIGSRHISVGIDTEMYYYRYFGTTDLSFSNIISSAEEFASEPLFTLLLKTSSLIGYSFQLALTIISLITLSFSYLFCTRVSKIVKVNPLSLFCCYLISFYIFGQQINIIRAGLASSFILNYYLSLFQDKRKSAIIYALIAVGIHFSSMFGIFMALVAKYVRLDIKVYMLLCFAALFVSYFNMGILNVNMIAGMDLGDKSGYLTSDSTQYEVGFRPGFAVFNLLFAVLFYAYLNRHNDIYNTFFRLYILLTCLFFICFQIPFSDRVGGFSWNLIPFLTYFSMDTALKKYRQFATVCTFIFLYVVKMAV